VQGAHGLWSKLTRQKFIGGGRSEAQGAEEGVMVCMPVAAETII
jgi:hypothetical protein